MATHVIGISPASGKVIEYVDLGSIGGGLADNGATNAKLADMATQTLKGRNTAGTGDPEDLSPATVRTMLNVADGATANSSDASLRDRTTHTGVQAAATISDLTEVAQDLMASTLVQGTNITLTYDDGAGTITIDAAAGVPGADSVTNVILNNMAEATIKGRQAASGTGDPEDLTAAQARTILNVADGATANSSDATLLARANHTGTQLAATISDFAEAVDDRVDALLVEGTGITLTYNDAAGTLTIDASVAASGNFNPGGTGAVIRTQDTKVRELGVSVLDYGADPTGVANASTAFTNAMAAALSYSSRTLYIPAGTYRLNSKWVIDQHLKIIGAGRTNTTVNSYITTDHAMEILGSNGLIIMRDFEFNGQATQLAGFHGVRIARKVQWSNIYVNGFTNDGIWYDTFTGGPTGAVFFSVLDNVWSKNNGGDGIAVRSGANANLFINCQFDSNDDYGFHHYTDGTPTYGNVVILGQCSYNGLWGWYWESGTDAQTFGLYGERNCCSTPGDEGTSYSTTRLSVTDRRYDFYIADNISRSEIHIGTIFGPTTNHVRAPARGVNDTCLVQHGGQRIFGDTSDGNGGVKYHMPYESPTAVADVTTANASDLATAIALSNSLKTKMNSLLGVLRGSNHFAP